MTDLKTCPDCGTEELYRHSFEECCANVTMQLDEMMYERDALRAERDATRKAVSFIQSGDYFIALCDDGSLWQVLITATDTAAGADWSRCAKPILGCREEEA